MQTYTISDIDLDIETYEVIPTMVYGTLRQGFGNHENLLKGKFDGEPRQAKIKGLRMLSEPGHVPFTYIGNEDDEIVVEIYDLKQEGYANTVDRLDMLEGYRGPRHPHNFYNRARLTLVDIDAPEPKEGEEPEEVAGFIYLILGDAPDDRVCVDWAKDAREAESRRISLY